MHATPVLVDCSLKCSGSWLAGCTPVAGRRLTTHYPTCRPARRVKKAEKERLKGLEEFDKKEKSEKGEKKEKKDKKDKKK